MQRTSLHLSASQWGTPSAVVGIYSCKCLQYQTLGHICIRYVFDLHVPSMCLDSGVNALSQKPVSQNAINHTTPRTAALWFIRRSSGALFLNIFYSSVGQRTVEMSGIIIRHLNL